MAAVSDIVLSDFVERLARPTYLHQLVEYLGDNSAGSYKIPDVSTPTVRTDSTHADPEALAPSTTDLVLNLERKSNVRLTDSERRQILNGGYSQGISRKLFFSLMGQIEDTMWDATRAAAFAAGGDNAADGDGGNILNKDLSTLTTQDVVSAIGSLDGPGIEDMYFVASPAADPVMRNLFRDQMTSIPVQSPMLGVPMDGVSIHGIPLVKSSAMPKTWTVAASASAVASGTWTITVPTGHGLQVGMQVTTAGGTNNITTAAAITAVTATSITVVDGSATDAANGAMTVSTNASVIALMDRAKAYFAGDPVPGVREVADARLAGGNALQAYATFGREVLPGFVRLLLVPNG